MTADETKGHRPLFTVLPRAVIALRLMGGGVMSEFIKWVFSSDAPDYLDPFLFILLVALVGATLFATFFLIVSGWGFFALALWVALPVWVIVSAYGRRKP